MLRNFVDNRRGGVAVIFAVAALPVFAVVGLAVDYSRATAVRNALQGAADASALAAARAGVQTEAEAQNAAARHFKAHLVQEVEVDDFRVTLGDNKQVRVEIDGRMQTAFGGLLGATEVAVGVASEAVRGSRGSIEIAFVLDNSGSMEGRRLDTLKRVTRKVIEDIESYEDVNARFALVPFTEYVNVGLSRRNEWWIHVPPDYETTRYTCWTSRELLEKKNCRTVTETRYKDGEPYQHTYQQCDYVYGEPEEQCGYRTQRHEWRGCVGSRNYPQNVVDLGGSQKVPGLLDISCGAELMPLTQDTRAVKNAVGTMTARGATYSATGLVWGWRLLSHYAGGQPYDPDNQDPRKVIVLLTDGLNTHSPRFPYHNGRDTTEANRYLKEICTNAKSEQVEIFTVAFELRDRDIKNILKKCATSEGHYFDAENESALEKAFEDMALSFMDLRITE